MREYDSHLASFFWNNHNKREIHTTFQNRTELFLNMRTGVDNTKIKAFSIINIISFFLKKRDTNAVQSWTYTSLKHPLVRMLKGGMCLLKFTCIDLNRLQDLHFLSSLECSHTYVTFCDIYFLESIQIVIPLKHSLNIGYWNRSQCRHVCIRKIGS